MAYNPAQYNFNAEPATSDELLKRCSSSKTELATSDEALEGCSSSKSDSALGSELVEDDVSIPLSIASLSDDDEDNDDDALSYASKSVTSSPTKTTANVSPSKTNHDSVSPSLNSSLTRADSRSTGVDQDSRGESGHIYPDANDNVTNPLLDQLVISSSESSSSLCQTCDSHVSTVTSDSRDDRGSDIERDAVIINDNLRSQRPVGRSLPQPHRNQQHNETRQHQQQSPIQDRLAVRSGVEDVESFSCSYSTLPPETDHLVDSCDEEDVGEAAAARAAVFVDEKDLGCEATSEKMNSIVEDNNNDNARNSSFSKFDPSSWPSWFERLFTNGTTASVETSLDDQVLVNQKGSCTNDIEPQQHTRTPSLSKSEFNCSCCFELMVEPTTIQCGHSFCRVCLANWYFGSNSKRTCPQCRQSWNGNPQTNVILRSAIRTLFPAELRAREAEAQEDVDTLKKLKRFEVVMTSQSGFFNALARRLWPRTGNDFVNGVVFSLGVFFVVYLAFSWRETEMDMTTVTKPIVDWRVQDVASWLDSLGPWTVEYQASFVDNAIDGQLVLALTDRDLQEHPFEMKIPYHRRAFLSALATTRTLGKKPPTNLWEYKAAKPGTALLLLWGLKSLPRHTILIYMLIFDYDSILLPFVHITCPLVSDRNDQIMGDGSYRRLDPTFWELQPFRRKALFFQSLVSSKSEEDVSHPVTLQNPSFAQWIEFIGKAVILPHYLVAEVAWDWLHVHYWTVRFILMDCLFLSFVEIFRLRLLCQLNFSQFFTPYSAVIQEIGLIVVVGVVWRFLPDVLCDVVFYSLLYVFPFLRMLNFAFRTATLFLRS